MRAAWIIPIFLLVSLGATTVCAIPAAAHDSYEKTEAKGCCVDEHCRPAIGLKRTATGYTFALRKYEKELGPEQFEVEVPRGAVRFVDLFGDRRPHWCGYAWRDTSGEIKYHTYCAFIPPDETTLNNDRPIQDASLGLLRPAASRGFLLTAPA